MIAEIPLLMKKENTASKISFLCHYCIAEESCYLKSVISTYMYHVIKVNEAMCIRCM